MKKKTLALFLAATLIAGSLAGCGGKKTNEPQNESAKQEEVQKEEPEESEERYLIWRLSSEPKQWDPTNNSESVSDENSYLKDLQYLQLMDLDRVLQKNGMYQKTERHIHFI